MRLAVFVLASVLLSVSARCAEAALSYNRDIRPILAESCFECHGPAKTKGDLRLDIDVHSKVFGSGELLKRLRSSDPEEQMPPPKSGKKALSTQNVETLQRWIAEGAHFEKHWSLTKITRPAPPSRAANPIDAFVQSRAAQAGLTPAPRASDRILRRRLAFDLTGLPPQPALDCSDWNQAVERLLAMPEFGERMAVWWLDLVRYADSEGYFSDSYRNVYPYRDYVVRAFNENKSFDRFTLEQLAGDLLPDSGWEQKIASGYNRLILTTHEDGVNEAEYRARYAADRVRNLGSVWLGMTIGCAQCHDHKFDPISQADFYRTAAFFSDIKEEAVDEQPETFTVPDSPEYKELVDRAAAVQREIDGGMTSAKCAQIAAERELLVTGKAPESWPRSKKTDQMTIAMRRVAGGNATRKEKLDVAAYFQRHYFRSLYAELGRLAGRRAKFETNAAPTLITQRGPQHIVRILPRGDWLDRSGQQVTAGVPGFGAQCSKTEQLQTRLDLAQWLVSRDNPLTARVLANRLWQLFFLNGLVRTPDDFGVQGGAPSNPELLDWLASELIESGWNIKHVIRLIVTSDAYRQSSSATPDALEKDPENRFFARQNRALLAAEFVRDDTLAVSGLLSSLRGGAPVKGYLPESFQDEEEKEYKMDVGERLYRRGLYLSRRRSYLTPELAAFNASTREECVSARARSATPRSALALLNAPQSIDAARAFAERIFLNAPTDEARLQSAFQIALDRAPSHEEISILLGLLESDRAYYSKNKFAAARFIRNGTYRWPESIGAADLACWTNVARAILNLEEMYTRY